MKFDDIIKQKLESYQAPTDANAWKEFESFFSKPVQKTPFSGPLISGIAATILMTVLFTTLPNIKSDSIESDRIVESDIELIDTSIESTTDNEINEIMEHIAQEAHAIPLMVLGSEPDSKKEETETAQSINADIEPDNDLQLIDASAEQLTNEIKSHRHEEINFTAKGIQCPNSTITFTAQLNKEANVTWVFDGLEVKNGLQVKHTFKVAREHAARMIVKFNDGYEQSITQGIEVYDTPTANFEMSTISNESCFDQMIELKGTPNSNTYKWVIDGDTAGKGIEFSKAVSRDLHTVGMHTINQWGCTSYQDKSKRVESGLRLDIPTAFSPTRQDGLNDTWRIEGLNNVTKFYVKVTRVNTNQVVFESNESLEWDGTIQGSADRIEAGEVFTYQVTASDVCGRTKQFSNTIRYL